MSAERKINRLPKDQLISQNSIPQLVLAAQLQNAGYKAETGLFAGYTYLQLLEVAEFYVNLYTENFPFMKSPLKYFNRNADSLKKLLRMN